VGGVIVPAMTTTHQTTTTDRAGSRPGRRSRSPLVADLDREWAHLRTSRRALRTARAWTDDLPDHPLAALVAHIADLDDLLVATQRRGRAERTDDVVLLALVELSQRGDELAGRVVLQHLLPALIGRSRRYRSFRERTDPLTLVVPAAWLAIRSYDVERRRHHVASSLLSDAVFQAFRQPLRRRSSSEEVWAPAEFAHASTVDEPATPVDEFVVTLREASTAGVDPYDIELLRDLVRVGSPSLVAEQRSVTPRTVRNHRDRAVEHVRAALAA
jgi:hypothetical protein